jgi:hypothetical protein
MMEVSRHKAVDTLRDYVRNAESFKDHAGALARQHTGAAIVRERRHLRPEEASNARRAECCCPEVDG